LRKKSSFFAKRNTSMEKNNKENVEINEVPKLNYRGWKVMPFIIGKQEHINYN
jgi:lipopolysaccharide biosynthesis protein